MHISEPCEHCYSPNCSCSNAQENPSGIQIDPTPFELIDNTCVINPPGVIVDETDLVDSQNLQCSFLGSLFEYLYSPIQGDSSSDDEEEEDDDFEEEEEEDDFEETSFCCNPMALCTKVSGMKREFEMYLGRTFSPFTNFYIRMECFSRDGKNKPFDIPASCYYKDIKIATSKLFKFEILPVAGTDGDWYYPLHDLVFVSFKDKSTYFYLSNIGDNSKLKSSYIEVPIKDDVFQFILNVNRNLIKEQRKCFRNEKTCIKMKFRTPKLFGLPLCYIEWKASISGLQVAKDHKYELGKKVKGNHVNYINHTRILSANKE